MLRVVWGFMWTMVLGGSEKFLKLDKVASRFKFVFFERRELTYTGIHFKQWDDMDIEYDQIGYIEKIKPMCVQKERRSTRILQ